MTQSSRDGDHPPRGAQLRRRGMGRRERRRHLRRDRPVHRRDRRACGCRNARRRAPRGRGCRGGVPRVGRDASRACARGSSCAPPTSSRAGATRWSTCSPARPAPRSASACSRCTSRPGCCARRPARRMAPVGEVIPSDIPGAMAMGLRQPVGVVGAIAPWNAALILSLRSITAPLVLGNTVVLKPSEWSPVSGGTLWGEIFAEAGLPAGVLNIVTHAPGEAAGVGDELVEHPAVRRLNFTGSTQTGRRLAEACGRQLKRVVLELGGSNPLIVLGDADLRVRGRRRSVRLLPAPGADLHVDAADHRGALDRGRVHREARGEDGRASRSATRRSTTRSSAR